MRPSRACAAVFAAALSLVGCGQKAALEPAEGQSLPVAPFGREEPPSAEALLRVPTQAQPQRNVELRKRSEEREDDPFDLPPSE